jgi:hypothetical protein
MYLTQVKYTNLRIYWTRRHVPYTYNSWSYLHALFIDNKKWNNWLECLIHSSDKNYFFNLLNRRNKSLPGSLFFLSFCHHLVSVVCHPFTFQILIFSSENPQPNELKLGRKHLWKDLSKECTFCYDPLPNMGATGIHRCFLPSFGCSHVC